MIDFKEQAESFAQALLGTAYKGARRQHGEEIRGNCPLSEHEDKRGSFGFSISKDAWACSCGNGKGSELRERVGWRNGNGSPQPKYSARNIVREYDYRDEKGTLLFQVVRFEPKDFRQRQPNGNGGWIWKLTGVSLVLYRLPQLLASTGLVLIPEGEKDVDNAAKLGFNATCNPMGAGKWRDDYSKHLAGRDCIIIPDRDEPGEKHAAQVAESLLKAGSKARVLRLPGDRIKDLSDWVAAGGTADQLQVLIEKAPAWTEQKADESSAEDEINRLAALPGLEYETRRKDAAKRLGIRADALDGLVRKAQAKQGGDGLQGVRLNLANPELWPDGIDGASLLNEIVQEIRRFIALPEYAAEAIALWIAHAHVLAVARNTFDVSPRLVLSSPTPRCGKTTLLTLIELLSPRTLNTANVTPAAVFRAIDVARPTLIVDEADALFAGGAEELRGILNAGHRIGAPVVRTVGDDHEPRSFDVFGPVALAAIGRLPGTLEDRAVMIVMRRRAPGEGVEKLIRRKVAARLEQFKRKLFRWATDHAPRIIAIDPELPRSLDDRAGDNWTALFSIADTAGGDWPTRAREAAIVLSAVREDGESIKIRLLADIQRVFEAEQTDRMASAVLAEQLAKIEDAPWAEWGRKEKPITPAQLARLLAGFGVRPRTIRTSPNETLKGYDLEALADALARYLPPTDPSHRNKPLLSGPNGQKDEISIRNTQDLVTDRDFGSRAILSGPNGHCDGVTDQLPGNAGVGRGEEEYARLEREAIQGEGGL